MHWLCQRFLACVFILSFSVLNAQDTGCKPGHTYQILFKKSSIKLTRKIKEVLDTVVTGLATQPDYSLKIIVSGRVSCNGSNKEEFRMWDRMQTVAAYVVSKGILDDRIIFEFSSASERNYIELKPGRHDEFRPQESLSTYN